MIDNSTKNTLLTFFTLVAGIILDVETSIIIARVLGPEEKRIYTMAILFPTVSIIFTNLGIGPASVYYIGKKKYPPKKVSNFFREAKRVLKVEGLLFITTPNRKFRLLSFQRPFNPEHYQEFTAKRLYKTLKTIFNEIEIKGIRAKKWIEEIERKRVRKSPYQVYIYTPLFKFLSIILPVKIKTLLKKYKSKIESSRPKNEVSKNNNQFNNLFQKFSMNDFYLDRQALDKSLSLFAICKKY